MYHGTGDHAWERDLHRGKQFQLPQSNREAEMKGEG